MRLRAAGPAALYLDLAESPSPATALALGALQRALLDSAPAWARDVVPGYTSLLIELAPGAPQGDVERWLRTAADAVENGPEAAPAAHRRVSVRYGEDADRAELEARLGLPWERIVALHADALYTVAFLGFTPGFPYLLGLPDALVTPRRETPRPRVPPGSVAIAGEQAGIYPSASPGGWWVVGRTDEPLFDPDAWPPTRWAPGDEVRFVADDSARRAAGRRRGGATDASRGVPLGEPEALPAVAVLEAWPPSATIQAAPRWRVGHHGMAQAGALDPLALALANEAAGNPAATPALELLALPLVLRALRPLSAGLAAGGHRARLDGRPLATPAGFAWPAGSVLELLPGSRAGGSASYLALAGGLAAHRYAGSASTDVRAAAGGSRKALEAGDVLGLAARRAVPALSIPRVLPLHYPGRVTLTIYPGPQSDPDVFARLAATSFRVAGFDRTGVRLDGPALPQPRADVVSEGSPWGAVQLPADGHPIVLLADRGRTGGYAKPAVVDSRDLWRLAQAPVGTEVWFVGPAPA